MSTLLDQFEMGKLKAIYESLKDARDKQEDDPDFDIGPYVEEALIMLLEYLIDKEEK